MTRDRSLLYAAALARSTGVGMSGVLVGLYASELGLSASGVGLVISAGLLGVALGTLVVMLYAERLAGHGASALSRSSPPWVRPRSRWFRPVGCSHRPRRWEW